MTAKNEAIALIKKIKDQANRATVVQDRSVGIIKQTCGYIFSECVQVLDLLKAEQPPVSEFTKDFREFIEHPLSTLKLKRWHTKSKEACDRLDASESENRLLRRPLEANGFKVDGMLAVGNELISKDNQIKDLEASRKELFGLCKGLLENEPHGITPYFDEELRKIEAAIEKETNIQTKEK